MHRACSGKKRVMREKVQTMLGHMQGARKTLFLNARFTENLDRDVQCQQFFYPLAKELEGQGFSVSPNMPDDTYTQIIFMGSKNVLETTLYIRAAHVRLTESGRLICAAGNKEGGTRLKRLCQDNGFDILDEISKNKMRIVIAQKAKAAIADDGFSLTPVCDGAYHSIPGLFGWDKIDAGSQLLLEHIPSDLSGHIADFGCGYGYLSAEIMRKCKNIGEISGYDADYRALYAFQSNITDKNIFYWDNLTHYDVKRGPFDAIVMNPPFHQDKTTDVEIGQSFIKSAARALKPKGVLYMVSNAHLPYEKVLEQAFQSVEKLAEERGFKVYKAYT